MAYTTEKLSRNRTAIYCDGEYQLQLRPNEVAGWIAMAVKRDADAVQDAADLLTYRRDRIAEYLAVRAARPKQLGLGF